MAQALTQGETAGTRSRAANTAAHVAARARAAQVPGAAAQRTQRELAHAARHRSVVRRGVWMGIAITLPLVAVAAVISYVSGSPSRYLAVAIGLAAGASMATQVVDRCHRAGAAAAGVTAGALLLLVPLSCFACVAAEGASPLTGMVEHVSRYGVGGLFAHYASGEPWRALAAVAAALAVAYLTGRGLGDGRLLSRLVKA